MWWMLLAAVVIIGAALVVARRRGLSGAPVRGTSVPDGEHMLGVEVSRHNDSGSTGVNGM
jgi:hypothetical protein